MLVLVIIDIAGISATSDTCDQSLENRALGDGSWQVLQVHSKLNWFELEVAEGWLKVGLWGSVNDGKVIQR